MIQAHLEIEKLGPPLPVYFLEIREQMHSLSRVRATVIVAFLPEKLAVMAGNSAVLRLSDNQEGTERIVPLMVTSIELIRQWPDRCEILFELSAPEALLQYRGGYRMFVEKSAVEIVGELLQAVGLGGDRWELRLEQRYAVRPQCVQYDESDWDFICRLLADEGIAFWFEAKKGAPLFVLADSEAALAGLDLDARVPFVEESQMVGDRHFGSFTLKESVVTRSVHLKEDSIRHPDVPFEARAEYESPSNRAAGSAVGEHFEYPARLTDDQALQARAKIRMAQLARDACVAHGRSNLMRIQAGRILELEGDLEPEYLGRYLVTEVLHHLVAPEVGDDLELCRTEGGAVGYYNDVKLVRADSLYRPALPRWPQIFELEPATTTGPEGDEIHVNDLGDVKLKMAWDRTGLSDDRTSFWARTLQTGLGGNMALPRVGWEVPVMYRDGDPDRPLVLGRLYNGASPLPCSFPGDAASTCFQSATTPGGGTGNEIRLGDTKGRESFAVSASRNQTVVVGGDSTTQIKGNEVHDVGLSYTVQAKSQMAVVTGEQNVNVSKNYEVTIEGGRTEVVGGDENNKVTGDRVVATGAYTESIGAAQAIQSIQSVLEAKGNLVNIVAGAAQHAALAGHSETVTGLRQHMVAAARILNCSSYEEKATGKSVVAGPSRLVASEACVTSCANGSLTAASIAAKASGKIVFEGKTINITASRVKTPGGTIGDGAVKVKGSNLSGNIKRLDVTKLGS